MKLILTRLGILADHDCYSYGEEMFLPTHLSIIVEKESRVKEFIDFHMKDVESIDLTLYDLKDSRLWARFRINSLILNVDRLDDVEVELFMVPIGTLDIRNIHGELEFVKYLMFATQVKTKTLYCTEFFPFIYTFAFPDVEVIYCSGYTKLRLGNRNLYKMLAMSTITNDTDSIKLSEYVYRKLDSIPDKPINLVQVYLDGDIIQP